VQHNHHPWRIAEVHVNNAAGGVHKPVLFQVDGFTGVAGNHAAVSEAQQADYLLAARARAAAEWPWVELFTVWNLVYGRSPNDEMAGYSLVDPDLSPRPAFYAWQELNQ
jgi:hypothetical protein